MRSRREKRLILRSHPVTIVALALAVVTTVPARADVTLAVGGTSLAGTHQSPDGSVTNNGAPSPLVELDVPLGALALHAESLPFERSRSYGDPLDPSRSTLQDVDAVLRFLDPSHRLAAGVGYGIAFDTTDRTAPRSSLRFEAGGVRLEGRLDVPTSLGSRLELTAGGIPVAHGTLTTDLGLPGAAVLHDAVDGRQFDATVREIASLRGATSFAYGVRYVDQAFVFAGTTKTVERNRNVMPFVELRLKL